jgi:hypothetical protein
MCWLAVAALLQSAMIATMGARWRAWLGLFLHTRPGESSRHASTSLSWREALVVAARGACAGVWTPAGLGLDGIRAAHAVARFQAPTAQLDADSSAAPAPTPPTTSRVGALSGLQLLLRGGGGGSGIVRAVALASLLDRLTALAILAALCLPFLSSRLNSGSALGTTLALVALSVAGVALLAWRVPSLRTRGATHAAAWTLATHAANMAAIGATLQALEPGLGASRTLGLALEVGPPIILSSALPLTPLGLGVADATGEALLAQHGLACGSEMVMLGRATWLAVCLLAGLAFWMPTAPHEEGTKD